MKRAMVELQMSAGSLEMLDRALTLARNLVELPFELNLWQAQNIWYEILRTSSYALTALDKFDPSAALTPKEYLRFRSSHDTSKLRNLEYREHLSNFDAC
jgi:hypothetical protein